MKATLRKIRISPKKANLIAGIVRGQKVTDALDKLKFMPRKGADILYKVVHSAASNAKNNFKQNFDELYIIRLLVTKGPIYKRHIPISRGRAHPINKHTSHITVEVGVMESAKTSKKTKPAADTAASEGKAVEARRSASQAETTKKKTAVKKPAAKKESKK